MPDPGALDLERRLARKERQIAALREIGLALESTMTLDEVLTMAVARTTRLMGAERSTLFLVADDQGLVSRVVEGDGVSEIKLAPGTGIAGWVALHGRPLVVEDARVDERFDPAWDERTGFRTRSVLAAPLVGRHGTVIGVTEILNKVDGVFDEEDLTFLGVLAGKLALSIENARLLVDLVEKNRALLEARDALERRCREIEVLLDVERRVARAEDLDALFEAVLHRTNEICRSQVCVLYRMDARGAESRVVVAGQPGSRVMRREMGAGFSGWVWLKGREIRVRAPEGDPRFQESLVQRIGVPLENLAAVPLLAPDGGRPKGSLLVANKIGADGFDEDDMVILRLVASQLSQAMEHVMDRQAREREQRLATVGRLLAGVLHDIKSPITVISGYSEMLAAKAGGPEAEEYLGHVQRSLTRISTMAEEIISFSKGERRILERSVSLPDFMDGFARQIRPLVEGSAIELSLRARATGTLRFDEEKMLRAFHNLVMNAVEAMPNGGKLIIEVDAIGKEVLFGFTDTGQGIPEEIQGNLFESFVTLGKEHGTGLGLAVTREIVEAHGGRISFTTAHGRGTTFLVSLPSRPNPV
ncbi:MAG: GAF domain-containing sensor histidine kinase [Deltaproteobacteria bacterium]|nr:GAF domain-containing sensor histidine kinase [Deltaproteobacteria bacterium]